MMFMRILVNSEGIDIFLSHEQTFAIKNKTKQFLVMGIIYVRALFPNGNLIAAFLLLGNSIVFCFVFLRKTCQNNVVVDIDIAPTEAFVSLASHCEGLFLYKHTRIL